MYILGNHTLCVYKYTKGTVDRINGKFEDLVNIIILGEENYLIASTSKITIYKNNGIDEEREEKITKEMRENNLKTISFLSKNIILGELIIMLGFAEGGVIFLNKNF